MRWTQAKFFLLYKNNIKKEKKYLEMMLRYGSDNDKRLAEGRLVVLNRK